MASPHVLPIICTNRQMLIEEIDKLLAEPFSDTDEYASRADQLIGENATKWGLLGVELREKITLLGERVSRRRSEKASEVAIKLLNIIAAPLHFIETWNVLVKHCKSKGSLEEFRKSFEIFESTLRRAPPNVLKGIYLFKASFSCFLFQDFEKGEHYIEEAVEHLYSPQILTFDKSLSVTIGLTRMMTVLYRQHCFSFTAETIDALLNHLQANDNLAILKFFSNDFFNRETNWNALRDTNPSLFTLSADELTWKAGTIIFADSKQYQKHDQNILAIRQYIEDLFDQFSHWFETQEKNLELERIDDLKQRNSNWIENGCGYLEQKLFLIKLFVDISLHLGLATERLDTDLIATTKKLSALLEEWQQRVPYAEVVEDNLSQMADKQMEKEVDAVPLVKKESPPKLTPEAFKDAVEKLPDARTMIPISTFCLYIRYLVEDNRDHLKTLDRRLILKLRLIADKMKEKDETYECGAHVESVINQFVKTPYGIWEELCRQFQTDETPLEKIENDLRDYLFGLIYFKIEDHGFYYLKAAYLALFLGNDHPGLSSMKEAFDRITATSRICRSAFAMLPQMLSLFSHLQLTLSRTEVAHLMIKSAQDTPFDIISTASKKVAQHRFDQNFWDSINWQDPVLFKKLKMQFGSDGLAEFLANSSDSKKPLTEEHHAGLAVISDSLKAFVDWFKHNEEILSFPSGESHRDKIQTYLESQRIETIRKLRFYLTLKQAVLKNFHFIFVFLEHKNDELNRYIHLCEIWAKKVEQEGNKRDIAVLSDSCAEEALSVSTQNKSQKKKRRKPCGKSASPSAPPSAPPRTFDKELPTFHPDLSDKPFVVQGQTKMEKRPASTTTNPEASQLSKKQTARDTQTKLKSSPDIGKKTNSSKQSPKLDPAQFPALPAPNPAKVSDIQSHAEPKIQSSKSKPAREVKEKIEKPLHQIELPLATEQIPTHPQRRLEPNLDSDIIDTRLVASTPIDHVRQIAENQQIQREDVSSLKTESHKSLAIGDWVIPAAIYRLFETFESARSNELFATGNVLLDLACGREPKKWTFITFWPAAKILKQFPNAIADERDGSVRLTLENYSLVFSHKEAQPGIGFKHVLKTCSGAYTIDAVFAKFLPDETSVFDFKEGLKHLKHGELELSNPGAKDIYFNHSLWLLKGCRYSALYRMQFSETIQRESEKVKNVLPVLLSSVDHAELKMEFEAMVDAFGLEDTKLFIKEQHLEEVFSSIMAQTEEQTVKA